MNLLILLDPLILAFSLREKENAFTTPSGGRGRKSAVWPIDPALSRNLKPPALAGGVFTVKRWLDSAGNLMKPPTTDSRGRVRGDEMR